MVIPDRPIELREIRYLISVCTSKEELKALEPEILEYAKKDPPLAKIFQTKYDELNN